jgi:hypothetical protein
VEISDDGIIKCNYEMCVKVVNKSNNLSQMNQVDAITIHFNIILCLRLFVPSGLFLSGFPFKFRFEIFVFSICATSPHPKRP